MIRRVVLRQQRVCVLCVCELLWGEGIERIPKDPRRKSSGGPRLRGPGSGACQDQLGDKPLVGYLENPSLQGKAMPTRARRRGGGSGPVFRVWQPFDPLRRRFRLSPHPWGSHRVGACGGDRGFGACQDQLGDKPLVGYLEPLLAGVTFVFALGGGGLPRRA